MSAFKAAHEQLQREVLAKLYEGGEHLEGFAASIATNEDFLFMLQQDLTLQGYLQAVDEEGRETTPISITETHFLLTEKGAADFLAWFDEELIPASIDFFIYWPVDGGHWQEQILHLQRMGGSGPELAEKLAALKFPERPR